MTLPIFPTLDGRAFPITRALRFDTAKEQSVSGRTARYARASRPKWRWTLDYEVLRQNYNGVSGEFATLAGFFAQLYGAAGAFLYADADDHSATAQSFGTGDGVSTQFQLVRAFGGFAEPVYAPTGTPSIYLGGTLQTTGYSINASGLVTFSVAPSSAAALTWTGTFSWLCEMDDDELEFSNFMIGLYSAKSLSFSNKLL